MVTAKTTGLSKNSDVVLTMPRIFDYLALILCSVVLLPLIGVLCVAVKLGVGGPIFFAQDRVGYKGKIFKLYKFRSMTNATDADGNLLPDSLRLTAFGRFFRSSSLDELPSFYNLLIGDLRLVGPRPLLVEYLPLYSAEQRRRHDVYPGFTGWAQVNGRNTLSWEKKFALDVWYVDNRSFALDLKILFMTIAKVLGREGVNASSDVTMPRFTGSSPDN